MIAVARTLMHQITNGMMMRESRREVDKELLKPMFFIKYYPRKEKERERTSLSKEAATSSKKAK